MKKKMDKVSKVYFTAVNKKGKRVKVTFTARRSPYLNKKTGEWNDTD